MRSRLAQLTAIGALLMMAGSVNGDIALTPNVGDAPSRTAGTCTAWHTAPALRTPASAVRYAFSDAALDRTRAALWSLQVVEAAEPADGAEAVLTRPVGVDVALIVTVLCGFGGALVLRPSGLALDSRSAEVLKYSDGVLPLRGSHVSQFARGERFCRAFASLIGQSYLGPFPARGPPPV